MARGVARPRGCMRQSNYMRLILGFSICCRCGEVFGIAVGVRSVGYVTLVSPSLVIAPPGPVSVVCPPGSSWSCVSGISPRLILVLCQWYLPQAHPGPVSVVSPPGSSWSCVSGISPRLILVLCQWYLPQAHPGPVSVVSPPGSSWSCVSDISPRLILVLCQWYLSQALLWYLWHPLQALLLYRVPYLWHLPLISFFCYPTIPCAHYKHIIIIFSTLWLVAK